MRLVIIIILMFSANLFAQPHYLEGTWQGIIMNYNETPKTGKAIWFNFSIDPNTGVVKGESRIETPFTTYYAYKNIKGEVDSKTSITFADYLIGAQKNDSKSYWCLNKGTLVYNDSTGYLSGKWYSDDCRGAQGEIVLYRSKYNLSKTDTVSQYHSWFNNMVLDLSKGWKAYYVRDAEMRDFEFVPVYFDHDKDVLKTQFENYLTRMGKIVNSHSDLRIKIVGHTDSNGSDAYNVNLSERRANRIKNFLMRVGVPADRIVIEYRGENDPATSNETSQGKLLNRRVDFEFI